MLTIEKRIKAFATLGKIIAELIEKEQEPEKRNFNSSSKSRSQKPLVFVKANIVNAFEAIAIMLHEQELITWFSNYQFEDNIDSKKTVAVVMAGNIPMVGFHDFLCVLMSGNALLCKLSSKDDVLLPFIFKKLIEIEPQFADCIKIEPHILKDFDAIIATGSNNSSRYFDYYFGKYPSIIRKNRVSIAVLDGTETKKELDGLVNDIFMYFGLGCRNVSKLFVPVDYDMVRLLAHFDLFTGVCNHYKYMNNYEYNKSLYLLNQQAHLDNGFVICKEDSQIFSPIAVVYFEKYNDIRNLDDWIDANSENIQCVVTKSKQIKSSSVELGQSQNPKLWDYADNIDTMKFLKTLN